MPKLKKRKALELAMSCMLSVHQHREVGIQPILSCRCHYGKAYRRLLKMMPRKHRDKFK